jgi:hypothetical protein
MIVDSLRELGSGRSVVIDEKGVILAGNATIKAAGGTAIKRVRVVDTDGDEIVAVRRTNLTEKQKKRLALYDNRAAELAEWDVDVLGEIDRDILDDLWTDDELDAILDDFLTDDEAAEIHAKPSFVVFSREQIAGQAFRYFRENGFPYPKQPLHTAMCEINRLNALVTKEALQRPDRVAHR